MLTGVGLIGCGTVGGGVARRLLRSHPGLIREIVVRDVAKSRDVAWNRFVDDPLEVVDDPDVGIVVECVGGLGIAREVVLRAIARGKAVVTANKELIATDGPWLTAFAERTGASLRYEAAVGGAIPIMHALAGALACEDVIEIGGILNGTTNFILDAMTSGAEYGDALAEAQRLGYAEANSSSDINGHDAAHKLAILLGKAVRRPAMSAHIVRRGIAGVTSIDVRDAIAHGFCLKLLAIARRLEDGAVEAGVTPAFVPVNHPFAQIHGVDNIVRVVGRFCGTLTFTGAGAGGDATAAAVVADVMDALNGRKDACSHHDDAALHNVGEVLIPRPLRISLPVWAENGGPLTTVLVPLDELTQAEPSLAREGVRSMIPIWDDGVSLHATQCVSR
ncbi:MAG: homoserine dehydrogenase, partial [Myxococcota bacterium]|nr:homoserine dehydrogenase [Myxococcota bacterium]